MKCPECRAELDVASSDLIYSGYNEDGDFCVRLYQVKSHCDVCGKYWRYIQKYEQRLVSEGNIEEDLATPDGQIPKIKISNMM